MYKIPKKWPNLIGSLVLYSKINQSGSLNYFTTHSTNSKFERVPRNFSTTCEVRSAIDFIEFSLTLIDQR